MTNYLRLSVNIGLKAKCHNIKVTSIIMCFLMQILLHNHFECTNFSLYSLKSFRHQSQCICVWCISLSLTLGSVLESPSRLDEEHRLIARYAARLAAEAGNSTVSVSQNALWWIQSPCITCLRLWQVIVMHFISFVAGEGWTLRPLTLTSQTVPCSALQRCGMGRKKQLSFHQFYLFDAFISNRMKNKNTCHGL